MIAPDPSSGPEPMKYALLGGDDTSDEEKLSKYCGRVSWSYLRPHLENESLYFLDPEIPLEVAGKAMSENRTEQVEAWLKSGDLVQLGPLHAAQWEEGEVEFEALVVSPFVLCRPV